MNSKSHRRAAFSKLWARGRTRLDRHFVKCCRRERLRINDPIAFPTAPSNASEPVIALVLPEAAGILVGDLNPLQVLGALEAELGGDAKPQWCAPLRRQRLFLEIERQNGLRLQRAGHVDAGRIAIEAFEIDVAGRKVGADAAQKRAQRHAAPLANLAPALDADMPGDLPLLRQCHELLQRPGPPVGDEAADTEYPVIRYRAHLPLRVIGVEAERAGNGAGRIGLRHALAAEQSRLDPVVEAQDRLQRGVDAGMGREVVAGQHRQRTERERAPQEAAPMQPFQFRSDLGHADGRFVTLVAHRLSSASAGTVTIIDFSVRGWITTSATWTRTKATMPNMMARWMPRAIG